MKVRTPNNFIEDFILDFKDFAVRRPKTTIAGTLAAVACGALGVQDAQKSARHHVQESQAITAQLDRDGFPDQGGYMDSANNVFLRILSLGACEFHDVEAEAIVVKDQITDIQNYSFPQGGITLHIENAQELQQVLPAINCSR